MMIKYVSILALAALTACGPMASNNFGTMAAQGLMGRLSGQPDSAAQVPAVELSRAMVEEQNVDLLRVSLMSGELTSYVLFGGRNGSKVTWLSVDGLSFTLDNGLLVATRGFGDDLMGADVAAARASLRNGGNHLRTHDFLNGLDQIERPVFQCTTSVAGRETITILERSYATTILQEKCVGEETSFENTYWRDANGVIWQSRQWISPLIGYLGYQRL